MLPPRSRVLALLCAFLALVPTDGFAKPGASLGLSLGYVRSECQLGSKVAGDGCFEGTRLEALFDFFERGASDPEPTVRQSEPTPRAKSSSSSGWNWFPTGGGGNALAFVAVVLAVILLAYGIYWTVAAIASKRIKLGLYYERDFLSTSWSGNKDFTNYNVERFGLQAGFYFFESVDLQLHVGVGPAIAQLEPYHDGSNESYALHGLSTKAGIGYVPADGDGPTLVYEAESSFFEESSVRRYVERNTSTSIPKIRRSGAVMLGWTHAF